MMDIDNVKTISFGDSNKESKHIAFCCDEKYVKYVGITVSSIIDNNPEEKFAFHIFVDLIGQDDKEKLQLLASISGSSIHIHVIDNKIFGRMQLPENSGNLSIATFYRFIVPAILKDKAKKVLYLDADIWVCGKLNDLFEIDLENKLAAVVEDFGEKQINSATRGSERLNLSRYFNAGVILFNIKNWNKYNLTDKSIKMSLEKVYTMADQDILNILFKDQVVFTDEKYNYQCSMSNELDNKKWEWERDIPDDICIIHYICGSKPWHSWTSNCKLVKNFYEPVLRKSLWKDVILVEPLSYKEMHQAYRNCKLGKDLMAAIYWYFQYAVNKAISKIKM